MKKKHITQRVGVETQADLFEAKDEKTWISHKDKLQARSQITFTRVPSTVTPPATNKFQLRNLL